MRDVVIPAGNRRDLDELPPEVLAAVTFHPVASADDALAIALRPARRVEATAMMTSSIPATH
jgi:ATP-dependent Lon protease